MDTHAELSSAVTSFHNAGNVNNQVASQYVGGNVNHYHGNFNQYVSGYVDRDSELERSLNNESANKFFEVPHLLSPVFTGRVNICERLDTALIRNPILYRTTQRRFILHGLGGSGKTQICLRYVHAHREKYWGIFWIDASTVSTIQKSFAQISRCLRTEEDIEQVKRVLTNTIKPWLMIFDNADNPRLSLSEYFPTGDRGDVIITSRDPGCRMHETVGYCEVGSMQISDSHSLLLRIAYGNTNISEKDKDYAKEIVNTLGHLALAVTQAGAYIREIGCSLSHYLELYRRQRQVLLTYDSRHKGTDYRYTVFTTWQVSLDRIEAVNDITSDFALVILRLICFYHHDRIPMSIIERAWKHDRERKSPLAVWNLWPATISEAIDLSDLIYRATALLASFSIVNRDMSTPMSLSLHPLVYDWCQARLSEHESSINCRAAIRLISASAPPDFPAEDIVYRRSIMPHVHACLQAYYKICGQLDDESDTLHWTHVSSLLSHTGFVREALELSEKMVQLYRNSMGEEHPKTMNSIKILANRYSEVGQRDKAVRLLESVVEICTIRFGNEHSTTTSSMISLAMRYAETEQYDKALRLSDQVKNIRKPLSNHEDIQVMQVTAACYAHVGRDDEALQLHEKVFQIAKNEMGEEHSTTTIAIQNLATRYSEAGRLDEALKLGEQVVELHIRQHGHDHPSTIGSMCALASSYYTVGRFRDSLELSKQTFELSREKLGEDHPQTIRAQYLLGLCYHMTDRSDEAVRTLERVVRLYGNNLGDNNSETVGAMENLTSIKAEIQERQQGDKPSMTNPEVPLPISVPEIVDSPSTTELSLSSRRGLARIWRRLPTRMKNQ